MVVVLDAKNKKPTSLLAQAYARARARGMKKIKVLFGSSTTALPFFDEFLPAAGVTTDIFTMVDNTDLNTADAELVLVDQAQKMSPDDITKLADCVFKTKAPVILASYGTELSVTTSAGKSRAPTPVNALLSRVVHCKQD